jgi:hypothetical protein
MLPIQQVRLPVTGELCEAARGTILPLSCGQHFVARKFLMANIVLAFASPEMLATLPSF